MKRGWIFSRANFSSTVYILTILRIFGDASDDSVGVNSIKEK